MALFSFGLKAKERIRIAAPDVRTTREGWLRSAFDAAPVGLAMATPDGHWLHFNETCCQLLGYSRSELLHYRLHDLTHPEDASRELVMFRRVLAGDQRRYRIEKRLIDKKGTYRTLLVSATLVRGRHGDPDMLVFVLETPQTPPESGHDAGRMATAVLEKMTDAAVIRTDARGVITGWNKGAERFLGYTRQDVIGKHRRMLYKDQDNWEDKPLTHLRVAAEEGLREADDFRVKRDGSHIWLHSSLTPYVPDGTVRGYIEVLSPLTDTTIDMNPIVGQLEELRGERDAHLRKVDELTQQLARREKEMQILAGAIRQERELRKEAETALRDLQERTVAQIEEPAVIPAPATLQLEEEPPWSHIEASPLDLLMAAATSGRTGSLILARGGSNKALFFDGGRLTCIASDDPSDFLGERLVRSGLISEPQRNKALQLAETTDLAFARCLVILGALTDDVVTEALRGKVEDDIEDIVSWTECSWSFVDREPPHRKLLQMSIDVYDLRAVREAMGSENLRALREPVAIEPVTLLEPAAATEPPRYIASRKGSRFHHASCTALRRVAGPEQVRFRDKREAKKSGLAPCGICMK